MEKIYFGIFTLGVAVVCFIFGQMYNKRFKVWLEWIKVSGLIESLEAENKTLKSEVMELRKQNKILKEGATKREEDQKKLLRELEIRNDQINKLIDQIKQRDLQAEELKSEIIKINTRQEDFETRLFKYLAMEKGLDYLEIAKEVGSAMPKNPKS